eukprot:COSAG01_NODE_26640_length_707_cov_2.381579_1_plen_83_part_10
MPFDASSGSTAEARHAAAKAFCMALRGTKKVEHPSAAPFFAAALGVGSLPRPTALADLLCGGVGKRHYRGRRLRGGGRRGRRR